MNQTKYQTLVTYGKKEGKEIRKEDYEFYQRSIKLHSFTRKVILRYL